MKQALIVAGLLTGLCGGGLFLSQGARADSPLRADSSFGADSSFRAEEQLPTRPDAAKPGKVTLSHEARKVLACEKVPEEQKLACQAGPTEAAKSGAKVKINPIETEGDPAAAQRTPQSVELEDKPGSQSLVLSLAPGNWELVWQGATAMRDKFLVKAGDEFNITLQTEIGVCRVKGEACSLDTEKRQQSVEVPTERGL